MGAAPAAQIITGRVVDGVGRTRPSGAGDAIRGRAGDASGPRPRPGSLTGVHGCLQGATGLFAGLVGGLGLRLRLGARTSTHGGSFQGVRRHAASRDATAHGRVLLVASVDRPGSPEKVCRGSVSPGRSTLEACGVRWCTVIHVAPSLTPAPHPAASPLGQELSTRGGQPRMSTVRITNQVIVQVHMLRHCSHDADRLSLDHHPEDSAICRCLALPDQPRPASPGRPGTRPGGGPEPADPVTTWSGDNEVGRWGKPGPQRDGRPGRQRRGRPGLRPG